MTDYGRIVAQERRFMRWYCLAWWLTVAVLAACVIVVYVWR